MRQHARLSLLLIAALLLAAWLAGGFAGAGWRQAAALAQWTLMGLVLTLGSARVMDALAITGSSRSGPSRARRSCPKQHTRFTRAYFQPWICARSPDDFSPARRNFPGYL